MLIGHRLKELREAKNLSQGDIEQRTGLMRCYTSRVENERTVPSIDTLEKYARELDLPLHMFFRERDEPAPKDPKQAAAAEVAQRLWGTNGTESFELASLAKALSRMNGRKRRLLLDLAHIVWRRENGKPPPRADEQILRRSGVVVSGWKSGEFLVHRAVALGVRVGRENVE